MLFGSSVTRTSKTKKWMYDATKRDPTRRDGNASWLRNLFAQDEGTFTWKGISGGLIIGRQCVLAYLTIPTAQRPRHVPPLGYVSIVGHHLRFSIVISLDARFNAELVLLLFQRL